MHERARRRPGGSAGHSARASATTTTERAPAARSAPAAAAAVAPVVTTSSTSTRSPPGHGRRRGEGAGHVGRPLDPAPAYLRRRLAHAPEHAAEAPAAGGAGQRVRQQRGLVVAAGDPPGAAEGHRDDGRALGQRHARCQPGAQRPRQGGPALVLEGVDGVGERPAEEAARAHRLEGRRLGATGAAAIVGSGLAAPRAAGRDRQERVGAERAERLLADRLAAGGAARGVDELDERAEHCAEEPGHRRRECEATPHRGSSRSRPAPAPRGGR